ncbi:MAG TPA: hypothetical protein PLI53_04485 [Geobacteraceae bacterium]|nr:hypothetical protein [Geobacteraceae bacterium]
MERERIRINGKRIVFRRDGEVRSGPVVYWMSGFLSTTIAATIRRNSADRTCRHTCTSAGFRPRERRWRPTVSTGTSLSWNRSWKNS